MLASVQLIGINMACLWEAQQSTVPRARKRAGSYTACKCTAVGVAPVEKDHLSGFIAMIHVYRNIYIHHSLYTLVLLMYIPYFAEAYAVSYFVLRMRGRAIRYFL